MRVTGTGRLGPALAGFWLLAFLSAGDGRPEARAAQADPTLPEGRRIGWAPGIPEGIPVYPIAINVRTPPYRAKGDGISDDTAAIQRALTDCPSRSAVFLPEGTYRLTSQLDIVRKSIVLRGDGPGKTLLKCEATEGDVIRIAGAAGGIRTTRALAGFTKGSTSLVAGNLADFHVGDYVLISQSNDPAVCENTRKYQYNAIGQIVRITGIAGKKLTINRPLYYTYDAAYTPQIEKLAPVERAGVEALGIVRTVLGGSATIRLSHAANCWVKDVESQRAAAAHVTIRTGYANVVRSSVFHHGHVYGGGSAYGVFLISRCTDNLIEDNIFYYLRHAVTLEWGGCGNVIAYNYAARFFDQNIPRTDWLMQSIHTHGGHPHMNLFEGNICPNIVFDNTLGSSRHNTVFRNHAERYSQGEATAITRNLNAIEVQMNNLYENIIGNVLGRPGDIGAYEVTSSAPGVYKLGCNQSNCRTLDPRVKDTLLRHGNFDYVTGSTQWDPDIGSRDLPNSYYLSSKPDFFGALSWPMIGPDLEPMVGELPAKLRFEGKAVPR